MAIHPISETGKHLWPDLLTSARLLVIYKHSPICGVSARAHTEVRTLGGVAPHVPVYQVDVIRQRGLSETIAADLHIGHESPQVILLCEGKPVWHTSHFRIKAATLALEIAQAGAACLQRPRPLTPTVI